MRGVPRWFAVLCVVAFVIVVCAFSLRHALAPASLQLQLLQSTLPADGFTTTELKLHETGEGIRNLKVESEDEHKVTVESVIASGHDATVTVRAGVMPGKSALRVSAEGAPPKEVEVVITPDFNDSFGDGTPDFQRLHDPADRTAFRGWFTMLAESQYYRGTRLPGEIDDCASLLRFSYREALRQHDSAWASGMSLPVPARSGQVHQYHYPHTPLGAAIFRVRDGSFQDADLSTGMFAEFADAKTLWRDDTYSVGRDLGHARPGDLLFFRQSEGHITYHAMIFLGASQIEPGPEAVSRLSHRAAGQRAWGDPPPDSFRAHELSGCSLASGGVESGVPWCVSLEHSAG